MGWQLAASDMFARADAAIAADRPDDAIAIYAALARDPDGEVRAEARFRAAMLEASRKRYGRAAALFRAILDEKPGAGRVELELARVLAAMGDEASARRALRQAQAIGLPPDVAVTVAQFAAALHTTKRFGGSIEVALAPDSNVNRATSARTLDTVIAPLTLSQDARATSGIGIRLSGQSYARFALTPKLALLPRLSALASLYRRAAYDDVAASALLGVEWTVGRDRLTPAIGPTWRWYGSRLYARTDTAALDWLHPLGRRAQLTVAGSVAHADYYLNPLQNGGLFDLSIGIERALCTRGGIGTTLGTTRQSARDPGYATTAGSIGLYGWRNAGQTTLFVTGALRRTVGDARLALFTDRRREWLVQAAAGATFRALKVRGFAPLVRVSVERNASTVGLYDYRRIAANVGLARAF